MISPGISPAFINTYVQLEIHCSSEIKGSILIDSAVPHKAVQSNRTCIQALFCVHRTHGTGLVVHGVLHTLQEIVGYKENEHRFVNALTASSLVRPLYANPSFALRCVFSFNFSPVSDLSGRFYFVSSICILPRHNIHHNPGLHGSVGCKRQFSVCLGTVIAMELTKKSFYCDVEDFTSTSVFC